MKTDKEIKAMMDLAYLKLKNKFDPKAVLFLDRIKRKTLRFKKLNETELKQLSELVKGGK